MHFQQSEYLTFILKVLFLFFYYFIILQEFQEFNSEYNRQNYLSVYRQETEIYTFNVYMCV